MVTKTSQSSALSALFFTTLFILSGCGGGANSGVIGTWQYPQYVGANGCITQSRTATTRDEYCMYLSNDFYNRDPRTGQVCATDLRQKDFAVNCPGYTWAAQ